MSQQPQFTDRAQTSLSSAVQLAKDHSHQQVTPSHLALALLLDPSSSPATSGGAQSAESLFHSVLSKSGVDSKKLETKLRTALSKIPQVSGGSDDISLSGLASKVITKANELMKQQHDSFIAQDHILLALLDVDTSLKTMLKGCGLANENLLKTALSESRGGKRIDSKNAEAGYDALNKYCTDLTALAQEGKIDPVIGRDE